MWHLPCGQCQPGLGVSSLAAQLAERMSSTGTYGPTCALIVEDIVYTEKKSQDPILGSYIW